MADPRDPVTAFHQADEKLQQLRAALRALEAAIRVGELSTIRSPTILGNEVANRIAALLTEHGG